MAGVLSQHNSLGFSLLICKVGEFASYLQAPCQLWFLMTKHLIKVYKCAKAKANNSTVPRNVIRYEKFMVKKWSKKQKETHGARPGRVRWGIWSHWTPFHYNSVTFWLRDRLLVEEPIILYKIIILARVGEVTWLTVRFFTGRHAL